MVLVLKRVLIFGLIICIIFIIWLSFLKISVRADGVTISTSDTSFYIPSKLPTKIYKFNPKPPELLKIIENNTRDYSADFGIYIKNISTGQVVSLNPHKSFNAASLYKLVLCILFIKKAPRVNY